MKKLFTIFFLLCASQFLLGQATINIVFSGAAGSETINTGAPTTPASDVTSFKAGELIINVTGCSSIPDFQLTNNGTPISSSPAINTGGTFTKRFPASSFNGFDNTNVVNLIVKCGTATASYKNIFSATLTAPQTTTGSDVSVFDIAKTSYTGSDPIIREAITHLQNTYDRKQDKAYIVIGPEGEVLSKRPVNIDEDDEFIVYLIAPSSDINNYNITSNGVYNPSDLSQTNPPNPNFGAQSATVIDWTAKKFSFGPYTTTESGVTFQITKRGGTPPIINPSQSLTFPINKFYHVDYAVSVITTDLSSPDFKVAPLDNSTDNTIIAVNEGKRAMITFNVIWYWKSTINKLFKKQLRNDPITRGRDRIKEPYFWDRLNPSFGLSIDQGFGENYFAGGVFEFARGGNISFGGHYGKFNGLADKKFKLGETVFTGTNDDIITTEEWKWGFYLGITLDTRIFNRITSSLGQQ